MKKPTLEYLSDYLPYSVRYIECHKASFTNQPDIKQNFIMSTQNMSVLDGKKRYRLVYAKLILKPLSDYLDINSPAMNELNCDISDQITLQELASKKTIYGHISYSSMQLYLKNHIDVFGLIEQDLAIDYNTLK